jgi:hypothetical protein
VLAENQLGIIFRQRLVGAGSPSRGFFVLHVLLAVLAFDVIEVDHFDDVGRIQFLVFVFVDELAAANV